MDMLSGRQVPYQEKHVTQQVSIIGNMEAFGIIRKPEESSANVTCVEGMEFNGGNQDDVENLAVVEFGAGRGYLTHMLADCYEMKKIFLIERRSYKLKVSVIVFHIILSAISLVSYLLPFEYIVHMDVWHVIETNMVL